MSLQQVSNTLWRQRNLLEMLLFKLEEEQLLLAAGRSRWISAATREAEMVLEEIRETEIARASLIAIVGPTLGLSANASLLELITAVPAPWGELFEEHRVAFMTLTDEIVTLAQANRELLARGSAATKAMLAGIGRDSFDLYTPAGRVSGHAPQSHLLDETL